MLSPNPNRVQFDSWESCSGCQLSGCVSYQQIDMSTVPITKMVYYTANLITRGCVPSEGRGVTLHCRRADKHPRGVLSSCWLRFMANSLTARARDAQKAPSLTQLHCIALQSRMHGSYHSRFAIPMGLLCCMDAYGLFPKDPIRFFQFLRYYKLRVSMARLHASRSSRRIQMRFRRSFLRVTRACIESWKPRR